jgi:ankyrin repeat protein
MRRLLRRFTRQTPREDNASPSPGPSAPETPALPYTPGTSTIDLCEAASAGNLQAVQHLLDAGTSVDAKGASGFTPFHRAVQHGHQQIARHLLSHGADTSAATTSGGIPTLHLAIAARDAEMAHILLGHGAFIELPMGQYGLTPLHLAVGTGPEDLVKLLLEMGANPKARCQPELDGGETVLHSAVSAGKDELLPMLLATGVDVNSAGGSPAGRTPLHVAAERGYEDAARTLLDAGADISARYRDGRTPLHLAAEHGQVDMIELLLERGAHVMAMTPQRETALCMAASHGKTGAAGVLLRQSLEVLTEDQKAMVMISAARAGSLEVVELLVGQGFSVNACDDSQLSALEAAAVQHHESVVIFLLRNGARPNSPAIRATRQIHNKRIRGLLSGALPLPTQQDMSGEISLDNVLIDRDSVQAALAGISTNAWRRRVMPTANPGGHPPNCWVCRSGVKNVDVDGSGWIST